MNLVVFDLDGTLAKTNSVDEICFVEALAKALAITEVNTDWSEYTHTTDSGVVEELFARKFGRPPRTDEVLSFVDCFAELLATKYAADAGLFGEIPGARSLLAQLKRKERWGLAIATGGWERTAKFKIKKAGLLTDDVPAAFAEDGPPREAIVSAAVRRALKRYNRNQFDRTVLVGDAIWDLRTARQLRLPFVGIADGARAMVLREAGASHILEDFLDYGRCLDFLSGAGTPE